MRQRQSFRGALGHGAHPAARMGRRRNLVRRRTHPQRRRVPAERFETAEAREFEIKQEPRWQGSDSAKSIRGIESVNNRSPESVTKFLPLPKGEGRGEGEGDANFWI